MEKGEEAKSSSVKTFPLIKLDFTVNPAKEVQAENPHCKQNCNVSASRERRKKGNRKAEVQMCMNLSLPQSFTTSRASGLLVTAREKGNEVELVTTMLLYVRIHY